jgi:hypothetical protein
MKLLSISLLILAGVCGCTWVNLSESGEDVQIGYAGNVQNCRMLGVVNVTTQSKVVVERGSAKVQEELYTLARNSAASMGATNLVQHDMPKDGAQSFSAYRCPQISSNMS